MKKDTTNKLKAAAFATVATIALLVVGKILIAVLTFIPFQAIIIGLGYIAVAACIGLVWYGSYTMYKDG